MEIPIAKPHWLACDTCKKKGVFGNLHIGDWIICKDHEESVEN